MNNQRFIPAIYAGQKQGPKKVVFGIPIAKFQQPNPRLRESLEACLPLVEAAGFEHGFTYTSGNPYISGARAEITRKALDWKADMIVYMDHDVSFDPEDMVKLLKTEGEVVGGTYRCKVEDDSVYMGAIYTHLEGANEGRPIVRADGCIKARTLPAGFLKVTTACLDKFMRAYPDMCYGPQYSLSVDLFNHGAHEGIWWGEDYAFCRKWEACGGENWLIPDMNINHWEGDKCYAGNYHRFLMRQPGGVNDPARELVSA
jgi:glycosyltransferase involved in cell wall biosynthesis